MRSSRVFCGSAILGNSRAYSLSGGVLVHFLRGVESQVGGLAGSKYLYQLCGRELSFQ